MTIMCDRPLVEMFKTTLVPWRVDCLTCQVVSVLWWIDIVMLITLGVALLVYW